MIEELTEELNKYSVEQKYDEAKKSLALLEKIKALRDYLQKQKTVCENNRAKIEEITFRLNNFQLELDLPTNDTENDTEQPEEETLKDDFEQSQNMCSDCSENIEGACNTDGVCIKDEAVEQEQEGQEDEEEI